MMISRARILFLLVFVLLAPMTLGASQLHESVADLEPFLGTWELDATWSHGATVWSKAIYRPIVDGRFVEIKTWVSDNGGPVYLRYHSVLSPGEKE
ncbi:MAG: hypothetical protein AAGD38_15340, partial [Acidobacteriota bacterium]